MTDASLYNGQPSDTGSSCQSARPTSCTSSISDDTRGGVSVKNALSETKQWFVLRVSYGRVQKAKEILENQEIESYVPLRHKQINKRGKKRIIIAPLLPSFIFVHATSENLERLLNGNAHVANNRPLLSYYYDHTSHRQDAPQLNPPLVVQDEVMKNFIKLTSIESPHVIPITSDNIQYKLGDKVVVTEGDFKGVVGQVTRIAGQQRVVVELFDGCVIATAYIPRNAMKVIEE